MTCDAVQRLVFIFLKKRSAIEKLLSAFSGFSKVFENIVLILILRYYFGFARKNRRKLNAATLSFKNRNLVERRLVKSVESMSLLEFCSPLNKYYKLAK